MKSRLKILATGFDYRPRLGGVATCAFETVRALSQLPEVEVRMLARASESDRDFDRQSHFKTTRAWLPSETALATSLLGLELSKHLIGWRPDAILNFLWLPEGTASLAISPLRAALGVPYFVVTHGVELMESRATLKKRLRATLSPLKSQTFRSAAHIFAVSHYTARLLTEECGVRKEKIRIIHNGVDPDLFRPRQPSSETLKQLGLSGKRFFLTVSRLHDYKGMDKVIEALPRLLAVHPDIHYVICGDGPDRERLEKLAGETKVRSNVVFTGALPQNQMLDLYNACESFVLMTREDRISPNCEGFGIVFLEAAACGKPAIGARSGGIPDAIADGETGWLVDPLDVPGIATAMLRCLDEPELASRMGNAGRERVLRDFRWSHVAEKIIMEVKRHVRN